MVNNKGQSISEFVIVMAVLVFGGLMLNLVINGGFKAQDNSADVISKD